MGIDLIPLCTFTGWVGTTDMVADTSRGRLMIIGLVDGRWEGERFKASQRGSSAADWLVVAPEGTALIDVRMTLRTDDGAFVFVSYEGRADWSKGVGAAPTFTAPRFETADERYAWMNRIQAVGKGILDDQKVTYEVYELR